MKRIIPALAVGLLAFGGCTDFRSDVFVQGHVGPDQGSCTYKPADAATFITGVFLPARGQQVAYGKLALTIGLQVINNTTTPDVQDANGQSTTLTTRDDAIIKAADVTITELDGTTSFAKEHVVASGYVAGQGGQGVVLFDLMGKEVADAIRKQMVFPKPGGGQHQYLMSIVLSGTLVSGTEFQTEPYQHELDVDYSDYFASRPDASGTVLTVAVLDDGGISDETITADGTHTLVDDGNAQYYRVLFGTYPDGGPIPNPDDPDGGKLPGLADADGGLFPTCE